MESQLTPDGDLVEHTARCACDVLEIAADLMRRIAYGETDHLAAIDQAELMCDHHAAVALWYVARFALAAGMTPTDVRMDVLEFEMENADWFTR